MNFVSRAFVLRSLILFLALSGASRVDADEDEKVLVNPYRMDVLTDKGGKRWDVREDGSVVNGTADCFDGAFDLIIGGSRLRYSYQRLINESRKNLALWFRRGSQFQIGPMSLSRFTGFKTISVTRHFGLTEDKRFLRYVDVFHNTGKRDTKIRFATRIDFGSSLTKVKELVKDDEAAQGPWAIAYEQRPGRPLVLHIVRGPNNIKLGVKVEHRSDLATESFGPIVVKAGQKVGIARFVAQLDSAKEWPKLLANFRESQALKGLPEDLRNCVVNFGGGLSISGFSLSREEKHDVIMLRSGKMLVGEVLEKTFSVKGLVGEHSFGRESLLGIKFKGDDAATVAHLGCLDQQIFAGQLAQKKVAFRLRNGPLLSVKVDMIESLGFRAKGDDKRAQKLPVPKAFIRLRTGDVLGVEGFAKPLSLVTRYGAFETELNQLRLVNLADPGNWGHGITLKEGSRFGCLVQNTEIDFFLTQDKTEDGQESVTIDREMILQIVGPADQGEVAPAGTFEFRMRNGDRLYSRLRTESLRLKSNFGVIKFSTRDLRSLTFLENSLVSLSTWAGNLLRGRIIEKSLPVTLAGNSVNVPLSLVLGARQNRMDLPPDIKKGIRTLLEALNSDDLEVREATEKRLKSLGAVIRPLLDEEVKKKSNSPDTRQRIREVLNALPNSGTELAVDLGALRQKLKAPGVKKNPSKIGVIGVLKIIANAQRVYRDEDRDKNGVTDYGDLAALAKHVGPAGGVSKDLATGKIFAYVVETGASAHERAVESRWWATAVPVSGKGPRYFINQSGVIYVSDSEIEVNRKTCDVPAGMKKWTP